MVFLNMNQSHQPKMNKKKIIMRFKKFPKEKLAKQIEKPKKVKKGIKKSIKV